MIKRIINNKPEFLYSKILLISLLVLCNSVFASIDQDKTFLNKKKWEKSVKKVNYSEDYKEFKQKESRPRKKTKWKGFNFSSKTFSYIALFIIIGLLIFLLLKVLQGGNFQINKRVSSSKYSFESELNEDINKLDLDFFLKKALEEKNYKLALRINFLMILKSLELNRLIIWKIDKTNGDYLSELASKNEWIDFAAITLTFEKVWYGDIEINNNDYSHLSKVFQSFNNKLNNES
ncbi:MAG: hypothetical protein H8E98_01610 [Bacteroidetes bacterium]|nr:hypothetical protein [Bacteroidota bacterium]